MLSHLAVRVEDLLQVDMYLSLFESKVAAKYVAGLSPLF